MIFLHERRQRFGPGECRNHFGVAATRTAHGHDRRLKRVVGIASSLLLGAPASALACAVCGFVGTASNTWAYQAMTAVLSLLPLAMIGGIVWWLARLAARADTAPRRTTDRVVGPATLRGSDTPGFSTGVDVAFDALVQNTSPTRRDPRPMGSSVTAG